MKRLIIASIISFLLYSIIVYLTNYFQVKEFIDSRNFIVFGAILPFCLSVIVYYSAHINFSIGVNVSWLSIALSLFVANYHLAGLSVYFWIYLFFLLFPLIFLTKHLFLSKELEERFKIQITTIVSFILLSTLGLLLI